MSIIRLIHITIDPSEVQNAMRVWKTECAPLMISKRDAYRRSYCDVGMFMNSSPIRNGKPKRILSTIVRLTLTRRSFGMHGDLKVRRHK